MIFRQKNFSLATYEVWHCTGCLLCPNFSVVILKIRIKTEPISQNWWDCTSAVHHCPIADTVYMALIDYWLFNYCSFHHSWSLGKHPQTKAHSGLIIRTHRKESPETERGTQTTGKSCNITQPSHSLIFEATPPSRLDFTLEKGNILVLQGKCSRILLWFWNEFGQLHFVLRVLWSMGHYLRQYRKLNREVLPSL